MHVIAVNQLVCVHLKCMFPTLLYIMVHLLLRYHVLSVFGMDILSTYLEVWEY